MSRRLLHLSSLALLLVISVVHIWVSGKSSTAGAVRVFPRSLGPVKEERQAVSLEAEAANPPPPLNKKRNKSQTEIFKEYFKSRLSDVNSTTNNTFHDFKRRIPSCPDPLHN